MEPVDIFADDTDGEQDNKERMQTLDDTDIYDHVNEDEDGMLTVTSKSSGKPPVMESAPPTLGVVDLELDIDSPQVEAVADAWLLMFDSKTDAEHMFVVAQPVIDATIEAVPGRYSIDVSMDTIQFGHSINRLYADILTVVDAGQVNALLEEHATEASDLSNGSVSVDIGKWSPAPIASDVMGPVSSAESGTDWRAVVRERDGPDPMVVYTTSGDVECSRREDDPGNPLSAPISDTAVIENAPSDLSAVPEYATGSTIITVPESAVPEAGRDSGLTVIDETGDELDLEQTGVRSFTDCLERDSSED